MKQKTILIACCALLCVLFPSLKAQDNCTPSISIDGFVVKDNITPENLAKCTQLNAKCNGLEENLWRIESFRIVSIPRNADPATTVNQSHVFSEKALSLFRNAKVDDVIFFEDIKLKSNNGAEMELVYILEVY